MSSHGPMHRSLTQRGRSSLDVERDNFEKTQTSSIQKAINNQETPVKEKHVRTTIIGSHQERGCGMFWSIVLRMPTQGNPIVCWKFCHTLHKLLRDGHANVILDSQKQITYLKELGRLWGHLREGYGRLIAVYANLLVQKLNFHKKNPQWPGNLKVTDEDLDKFCENDINSYFELCVDLLDFMDTILALQAAVFGSLDMSRANSMTAAGQCRLSPLIPCIQESCSLYDYTVKILFRLHSSLPPDTLSGHRVRFFEQYKILKRFYHSSRNLQYFKNLISIPTLPENPPNFLVASEFKSHVTPKVVIPEEPPPEVSTPEVETLVDTEAHTQNGAPMPPVPDGRDLLIQQLQQQIIQLRKELSRVQAEDQMLIESLKNRIQELELEIQELSQIQEHTTQENESLKNQLKETDAQLAESSHKDELERMAKVNEEKFRKMKTIYSNLREEHVKLLRTHAESNKSLIAEKREKQNLETEKENLVQQLESMNTLKAELEDSLHQQSSDLSSKLDDSHSANDQLASEKQSLLAELEKLKNDKLQVESSLNQSLSESAAALAEATAANELLQKEKQNLNQDLHLMKNDKIQVENSLQQSSSESAAALAASTTANEQLQKEKQDLEDQLKQLETAKADLETSLSQFRSDIDGLKRDLSSAADDHRAAEEAAKRRLIETQLQLLAGAIEKGEMIIKDSLDQFDNPVHASVTSTAEYLLNRAEPVMETLDQLRDCCSNYAENCEAIKAMIGGVCDFSHRAGEMIVQCIATSHSAPIEQGEDLSNSCRKAGDEGLALLALLKQGAGSGCTDQIERMRSAIQAIMTQAEHLVPKVEDVKAEQMGDLIDQEMEQTSAAIEKAAARIQEMLERSREGQSGVQLEVNEKILDSCTSLMKAIKVLIEKSKSLQREIVSQGRGTASAKEFYKRHHRWTEGLISAAKAVGWGANVLVEAADKVVGGEGKFEELMVCSQEIAASTIQLVVSSKVKADRKSASLGELSEASKSVTEATGQVVASVKSGAQMIEDLDTLDFSKLTLHVAKRKEMESQVRVLELESNLVKERRKLSELRKTHYQLAGESEGWEVEDQE